MTFGIVIAAALALAAGLGIGWYLWSSLPAKQKEKAEASAKSIRERAEADAKSFILSAKDEAHKLLEEAKQEERERLRALERRESEFVVRERELLSDRKRIDQERDALQRKQGELDNRAKEIEILHAQELKKLEEVAHLSVEEAHSKLLEQIEKQHAEEFERKLQQFERQAQQDLQERARDILITAIQRYGASHASEVTTTSVALPSEELKGRIIGKEGRNIKAFERASGCELLVDDTPGAVVISGFDPVRREVAKRALEKLLVDGRMQPARIEEVVAGCQGEVDEIIRKAGEDAIQEVGVVGLDPRLVYLLGRLRFRTSFGQHVLQHSIEAAHLAGMIAAEIGANVQVAKKGALFHDIGKAIDHEVEGTHVEIGRKLLARFGVEEPVIKAMQSHHEEYPFETPESVIVKVAESISAARPGARRDTVENYLRRLSDLERIATSFPGVEKAYAIQAGREVRVFVVPEEVDDLAAKKLARAVADQIEQELQYPGEIKVNVVRETRVAEFAR
ncbi:MAG: ribonuclease Y [Candidatus Terrybacteria bacterium RIFCSPHIGHO2_01_FULL_48_17]|uniref:Ribonuclease Y n=1 Tax=Candidatus Terrybacteria bacterium RIFCSPHIGHO2_01_FULL_48_17 TaxID=1802362 RepID=A0A1G2PMU2_9BACT|nr:MAG: ribonuclease Y [Candidatus Terrybacteria bacterium RIFCSPHIGHO2_01_FULL_48_17]OHA52102.1 MAG: ribonuclease Y [Candidatus Terrybacteria bacterium RIFCSPLOWO2_01_FULL_48_14]